MWIFLLKLMRFVNGAVKLQMKYRRNYRYSKTMQQRPVPEWLRITSVSWNSRRKKSQKNNLRFWGVEGVDYLVDDNGLFYRTPEIRAQVADLKDRLNSVLYNGIDSAGALIREQIFAEAEKNYREMMNQLNGTASISFEQQKFLASIDDVCLREQVYRMLCSKDAGNDLQQLLEQARQKMSETRNKALNSSKTELLRSLKERIVKYNVPTDRIDRIIREDLPLDSETLAEINREVEDKINAELIRKKAVAVILKSIRKQGFIVDLKQCIKLDPKTNTVNIAVKRPDGKMVQFEVNLDGSFMYHFEGYDGMTCLKDEDGFNETLEKVYGMQITGKKVIWENPDRTASMKRQSIKSSSGHLKS